MSKVESPKSTKEAFAPTVYKGICRVCGCTQEDGCAEGCQWVDRARTLCSSCDGLTAEQMRARRDAAIEFLHMELYVAAEAVTEAIAKHKEFGVRALALADAANTEAAE